MPALPNPLRLLLIAIAFATSGCAHYTTLPRYVPEASWGKVFDVGCATRPQLELAIEDIPGLTFFVGASDDDPKVFGSLNKTTSVRPLLVVGFRKSPTWFPSLLPEKERKVVSQPVTVKAASGVIAVTLADGTTRQLLLGADGMQLDMTNIDPHDRFRQNFFPLENVLPQSFAADIPDFLVNDRRIRLGPVKFDYRPTKVFVGC